MQLKARRDSHLPFASPEDLPTSFCNPSSCDRASRNKSNQNCSLPCLDYSSEKPLVPFVENLGPRGCPCFQTLVRVRVRTVFCSLSRYANCLCTALMQHTA